MKLINLVFLFILIHAKAGHSNELECARPSFSINGLDRTSELWFRDYLQLDRFSAWNEEAAVRMRQKILTTDIFTFADIQHKTEPPKCVVTIDVKEKWTTIPVVRGAYGGGTPLVIVGGYETNAFGRLLALGGELRRYGSMAPGAFFFFKSPRAWRGRGLWGGELWLDRRQRDFFDSDGKVYGYVKSESWTGKFQWLYPIGSLDESGGWQAGFQSQLIQENPSRFVVLPGYSGTSDDLPDNLRANDKPGYGVIAAPMIAYDDLSVDGLNYSGQKSKFAIGAAKSQNGTGRFAEAEIYGFSHLPGDINLAGRIFAASTSENTVGAVYYLGGFDSIRGLPDGIHYGNNIVFGNFEARMMTAKWQYAHLQSALFVDSGSAWMRGDDFGAGRETSLGAGIRIAIPQIYRFVIRIDYGLSVGATKSRGLSIGLNQFFQPYKLVF
jgi:hypothetical protein